MKLLKSFLNIVVMTIFVFALFACSDSSTDPSNNLPRSLQKAEEDVLASSQKFGLNIYKRIAEDQPDSNVFISPLSISTALSMALNGAVGETYNEMHQTLEMNDLTLNDVNAASKSLVDMLTTVDPKVVFTIANSVWYRQDLTFQQNFMQAMTDYYNAKIEGMNFADPATVDVINGWVYENTNHMIEEVITEIDPAVVMFLINALYFNGTWQKEFNAEGTINDYFYLQNGSQVDCKMMLQDENYKYFETDDFQAVDLPYGDGHYSMSVFLPKDNRELNTIYTQLTDENWANWIGRFTEQEIRLMLPKFEVEYEIELLDVLKAMGMRKAFSPSADFTNLFAPGGIYISRVLHKTAVKVNEEGTEAAAVTVISFERLSAGDGETTMHVNKPFLYVIRENSTGTILFIGQVVNPVM